MNCGDSIRVVHPLFQEEDDGSIPISPLQLEIEEMPIQQAILLNNEWHSSQPEIKNAKQGCIAFGAFFKNHYYAISIWGVPIARKFNGLGYYELRRMAIADNAPKNTGSRMLKIMRLLLVKKQPQLKKLISYQDTAKHTGPLYKSAGWIGTPVNIPLTGWDSRDKRDHLNNDKSRSFKIRWEFDLK